MFFLNRKIFLLLDPNYEFKCEICQKGSNNFKGIPLKKISEKYFHVTCLVTCNLGKFFIIVNSKKKFF